ncbi:MAG: hypothetical protein JW913_15160 [Chitinispirillaceae bacterium]|nr:hypothetical protein [Chitinispirillaceae bacterium]
MNNDRIHYPGFFLDFLPGLLFLSILFTIEFIAVLVMNSGHFIYTLDDPYIHLALAENITRGHYGINPNEFSAPSSSIVWPFILAPFAFLKHFELVPLLFNFIASLGTVVFFTRIVRRSIRLDNKKSKIVVITFLIAGLIVCTNVIGLIFTGMEQSLQVLFTIMIIDGLMADSENEIRRSSLAIPIILGPLIRYENLAVSLAAIGYLCFRKRFHIAAVCTLSITLLVTSFSLYLTKMGIGPIPTSLLAKSSVVGGDKNITALLYNLSANLVSSFTKSRGLLLICALAVLSIVQWTSANIRGRLLAGAVSSAILMHLLAGSYGGYNRYEIYIWTAAAVTMIYMFGEMVYRFLMSSLGKKVMPALVVLFGVMTVVSCFPYILGVFEVPFASNNIYEQHFQMRRFAIDFYRESIAVNDIGLVSYRNGNYVLDLAGLASKKALTYNKMKNPGSAWMDELAQEKNVKFAMIYETWFDGVPGNWIRAGELHLGKKMVTPADSVVSFFACDSEMYNETRGVLEEFGKTLPAGVKFVEGE